MTCDNCKKRDRCVTICIKVQKIIAKNHVSRRELPLKDRSLIYLLEDHLRANKAFYVDRHSKYLPELKKRLEKLTALQRNVIEMYYFEGLSINEISLEINITPQAVGLRLKNAISRLRNGAKNEKF